MRPTELAKLVQPRRPELRAARRRLRDSVCVDDLRDAARRRLPRAVFDFVDGGSDDETALRRNSRAFGDIELFPRVLRDVSDVDLGVTLLGTPMRTPIGLSPSGFTRLVHHEGELAVTRAADRAGALYVVATMANVTMEELAQATSSPLWFQLYIWHDRALSLELLQRARAIGCRALVVTVDVPVSPVRRRDLRSGITMPPKLTRKTFVDGVRRPAWSWNLLTHEALPFANVTTPEPTESLMAMVNRQFDPSVTWEDLSWIREAWDGPIAIKGIVSPDDARRAVEVGFDAVWISNHGGRQLNDSPATIAALPAVVDAVGGEAEVYLDSGVRHGADVLKALALGATACFVGRPYLYGLAAGGEAGVARMLEILEGELRRTMMLVGARSVADLDPSCVRRVDAAALGAAGAA